MVSTTPNFAKGLFGNAAPKPKTIGGKPIETEAQIASATGTKTGPYGIPPPQTSTGLPSKTGDMIFPGGSRTTASVDKVKKPNLLEFMNVTGASQKQAQDALRYGIWQNYTPEGGWGQKDVSYYQQAQSSGQWTPSDGKDFKFKWNEYDQPGAVLPYYRKWHDNDYTNSSFLVLSGGGGKGVGGGVIPAGFTKEQFYQEARGLGVSDAGLDAFAQRFGAPTFRTLDWDRMVKGSRINGVNASGTLSYVGSGKEGNYRFNPGTLPGDYAVRGNEVPYIVKSDGTQVPLYQVEGSSYYGMTPEDFEDRKKNNAKLGGLMMAAMGKGGFGGGGGGVPTAYDLMTRYSEKDNPLMAQARGQAMQISNSRGLLNSSIATQAGEEAALGAVLPLASQDADNAAQKERLGMQLSTQERIALAQIGSQERLANLDIASRERMQGNEISYQTGERALDRSLQEQLAEWNLSSSDRDSAARSVISMEQLYNQQYANIMANTNLSADDRQAQLTAAKALRDRQLDLIQQLYSINLDWGQAA